jgi:excisionase family DNA binding protein
MDAVLIGKSDASVALGISIRMLEILIARGQISVQKIGRRVLIARAELERFANASKEAR